MSTCASEAVDLGETTEDDVNISTVEGVERLYRKYKKTLTFNAARLVPGHNQSDAEDVLQEVFVRALSFVKDGGSIDSQNFLFITSRNLIISMFYRAKRVTHTDSVENFDDFKYLHKVKEVEDFASVQQKVDQACEILAQLPPSHQEAFIRRRVWGESCREIADKMCLSESVVANYTAFGWKRIQEILSEEGLQGEEYD